MKEKGERANFKLLSTDVIRELSRVKAESRKELLDAYYKKQEKGKNTDAPIDLISVLNVGGSEFTEEDVAQIFKRVCYH